MRRNPPPMDERQAATRRPAAVRTAVLLGAIALAIYVGFILSGMLGR